MPVTAPKIIGNPSYGAGEFGGEFIHGSHQQFSHPRKSLRLSKGRVEQECNFHLEVSGSHAHP
jgi:hypothetical protein